MYKIIIGGLLILLSFVFLGADSPPIIVLKPGMNEISIKVQNKCDLDLKSIQVVVKEKDLPEGVLIFKNSQPLDVTAKSNSETGLLLGIEVNEKARPGIYQIPFMLKDKANHSWNFILTAKLEINKPENYDLLQNYPNPFNSNTELKYLLANDQEQETRLVIFDLLGQQIRTLVNKKQPTGTYTVIWDSTDDAGKPVSSSIYFYKITSGPFVKIKKMMLLK